MTDKFKDFDKFFEEKQQEEKQEKISFKFSGIEYEVPASMPAIIPVKMMRLKEEYGSEADIPGEETYKLMLKLMKEGELEKLAQDATTAELNEILMWILAQYSEEEETEEDDSKN